MCCTCCFSGSWRKKHQTQKKHSNVSKINHRSRNLIFTSSRRANHPGRFHCSGNGCNLQSSSCGCSLQAPPSPAPSDHPSGWTDQPTAPQTPESPEEGSEFLSGWRVGFVYSGAYQSHTSALNFYFFCLTLGYFHSLQADLHLFMLVWYVTCCDLQSKYLYIIIA